MRGAFPPVDLRLFVQYGPLFFMFMVAGDVLKRAQVVKSLLCAVVIKKPYEKTESYTSVDRNVHGRKPSP